jgi:hypothetical protein
LYLQKRYLKKIQPYYLTAPEIEGAIDNAGKTPSHAFCYWQRHLTNFLEKYFILALSLSFTGIGTVTFRWVLLRRGLEEWRWWWCGEGGPGVGMIRIESVFIKMQKITK